MKLVLQTLACLFLFCVSMSANAALREWIPTRDSEVVEHLVNRVRPPASTTPEAAAEAARQWITLSRHEADPRYLGRAQAVLAGWWDKPDAPAELAVLQATIQQSRHEFGAARKTLQATLSRNPLQAQGWLTMATLERLSGHYDAAAAACTQVQRSGASLYASACRLETQSLLGNFDRAETGYESLMVRATDPFTQAWLLSLNAESEERAGHDAVARASYKESLKLEGDGYTALAYADMLIRLHQPAEALKVLADQPKSDSVLIRQGKALRLQGDPAWKAIRTELTERFAALDARGEDSTLHARERGLAALWLDDQPAEALRYAQANLSLQKEPLDWWLVLASAEVAVKAPATSGAVGQDQALNQLKQLKLALQRSGLRDARLGRWQPALMAQGASVAPTASMAPIR